MRVRTQTLIPGRLKFRKVGNKTVYANAVEILSLDQFIRRARKLSGYSLTPRQLLTRLLALPLSNDRDDEHLIRFSLPSGGETLFWLEK